MPPFYPREEQDQYSGRNDQHNQHNQYGNQYAHPNQAQYQNGIPYYGQYDQYQYNYLYAQQQQQPPPQPIPPYSNIQINVPSHAQPPPQSPSQYQYQRPPPQMMYHQPSSNSYQYVQQTQPPQQHQQQQQHQYHQSSYQMHHSVQPQTTSYPQQHSQLQPQLQPQQFHQSLPHPLPPAASTPVPVSVSTPGSATGMPTLRTSIQTPPQTTTPLINRPTHGTPVSIKPPDDVPSPALPPTSAHTQTKSQVQAKVQESVPAPVPARPTSQPKAPVKIKSESYTTVAAPTRASISVSVPPAKKIRDVETQRALQTVNPNKLRVMLPPKPAPQSEATQPQFSYEILLLTLADEYLEAAAKMTVRSEDYFKLTATALGCIEAALNSSKLPPLRQAQIGLRFAQILHNETDNMDTAETVLTRTIDLCVRMKFIDLKYAAQLLLAQVLHRSSHKAALKHLLGMIQDVETYKHWAWEYALRLQIVMFYMESGLPNDIHLAAAQLERLQYAALRNGDDAVYVFAAVLEGFVQLQSGQVESMEAVQRALGNARKFQNSGSVSLTAQTTMMIEFLDLCSNIKNMNTEQADAKRKIMQKALYDALEGDSWRHDGLMYVPIQRATLRAVQLQESGIIAERGGRYFLALHWLPKEEVEDLGYLLSGVSAAARLAGDSGRAEKFFEEGLDLIRETMRPKRPITAAGDAIHARRQIVECHFLLERTFLLCSKGQWEKADDTIELIKSIVSQLSDEYPFEMRQVLDYAKGVTAQGKGEIDEALNIFALQIRRLYPQAASANTGSRSAQAQRKEEVLKNLSILSAMNTVFIVQQPNHPQNHRLQQLVNLLDPLVHESTNKLIPAAWNLILASMPGSGPLKSKHYMSLALHAAQALNNAQITMLCLVAMQEKFFKGLIGDQALKCARAASHQAQKLNEPLWTAVAMGLEADCLRVQGKSDEAVRKKVDAEKMFRQLPEKIQQS